MTDNTLSDTTYGLIGHPLAHSRSKAFFTALFAETGSGESYDNFDLPELTPDALYRIILLNPALKGLNVTAPYKVAIMQFLDSVSPEAAEAGAVNTVAIRRSPDGRLLGLEGHNTDVEGFLASVRPMAEKLVAAQGALVAGTGGASKAVEVALRQLGVPVTFVSRSKRGPGIIAYDDIDADILRRNPLIINATPLGTWPDTTSCPPLPYHLMGAHNMCHDLVYNPEITEFMKRSAEAAAEVKNGLEMLHGQAIASLNFWKKI